MIFGYLEVNSYSNENLKFENGLGNAQLREARLKRKRKN